MRIWRVLGSLALVGALALGLQATPAKAAGPTVLCSTGDGWCTQATIASIVPGATVTKWTSAQFNAASVSAFQAFNIIYLDHRFSTDASTAAKNVYGAAINGRAVITGVHFEHCGGGRSAGPCLVFGDSADWIFAGGGTGLLVSTQYNSNCANWIPAVAPFNGISYSFCGGGFDIVKVTDPGHATMATSTNATLSNFGNSSHSIFGNIGGFTSVAAVCDRSGSYAGGDPAAQCTSIGGTMRPHVLVTSVGVRDQDGDGIPDNLDDCPTVSNPGQQDANGNGVGDACESAPTVTIAPQTSTVASGTSITFTTTAQDADDPLNSLTYEWRLDGIIQPAATGATFMHTFTGVSGQTFTVRVTVRDPGLLSGFDEATVTIGATNRPPTASPDAQSVSFPEGQTATNTGTYSDPDSGDNVSLTPSIGAVTKTGTNSGTWSWSFGTADGPAESQTVTITANDGTVTANTSFGLTVLNVDPTAALANNGPIDEGGSATISFSAQADPSPADLASLHYAYDCNGGSLAGATYAASGTSTSTSCPFNDNGSFPVTGKVMDKDGGANEYTTTVVVNNVAPTATFTAQSPVDESSPFSLSLTSPSDSSSADTTAGFTYAFDCGDGSGYGPTGPSNSTSCPTTDDGTRNVKGKIFDKDGGSTEYTAQVRVNNAAPRVAADLPSVTVNEGQTAANTGTYSDPATGDDVQITTSTGTVTKTGTNSGAWSWSFGTTDGPAQSQTITMTANDGDGGVTTTTFALTVNNVAPTATFGAQSPINEGQNSTLALTGASDPSSVDTAAGLRYSFACDGLDASLATTYGAAGTASTASCTFGDNGTYTVKGRVLDKDDGQTTYQAGVTVNNLNPALRLDRSGVITFAAGTAFTGRKGITQTHSAGATDPGSDDLTFAWSAGSPSTTSAPHTYDNNGSSADPAQSPAGTFPFTATNSPTVTFSAPGIYTLTAQVRDDDAGSASDSQTKLVVDDCDCTKSQGFWKHELDTKGKQKIDDATLRLYLSIVRFASGLFGPGDPMSLDTLDQARHILDPQQTPNNSGSNGKNGGNRAPTVRNNSLAARRGRASAQALAAWLNFAKGGILWDEMVDTNRDGRPDMRFRDLIAQVEAILKNPNATKDDLDRAKNLAEAVNQHDEKNGACDTQTGTGSASNQATRS